MKTMKWISILFVFISPLLVMAGDVPASTDAAKNFVQDFYDWYVPLSAKSDGTQPDMVALNQKGQSFDHELGRALRADLARQARTPGEIVGIDFDPFLNAQDLTGQYVAGAVHPIHGRFRVDVWSRDVTNGPDKVVVIAEVVRRHGTWQFTNFYYPKNGNLKSILRAQKNDLGR